MSKIINTSQLKDINDENLSFKLENERVILRISNVIGDSYVINFDQEDQTGFDVEIVNCINLNLVEMHRKNIDKNINFLNKINVFGNSCIKHVKVMLSEQRNITTKNLVGIYDSSTYEYVLVDLNRGNVNLNIAATLYDEHSSANIDMASICGKDEIKKYDIDIVNTAKDTTGLMSNYGIALDNGVLDIVGTGEIKKGAKNSTNRQATTIIVFDEKAKATSKPYLFIDDCDVVASHASAVGMINDEQIFYLCSRGLSINEAKRFISLGHFKPVIGKINNSVIEEEILKYIEGMIK